MKTLMMGSQTAGTGEMLGLYLSVPFCRAKCSYCNFASGVYPVSAMPRYVERLIEDLPGARAWAHRQGAVLPAEVDSIYLGGGTPSLLPPALLEGLLAAIRAEFRVAAGAEITLECAPGQVEDDVLAAMVQVGVNRVSFGVQSFVDREAAATGRLHTRDIALQDIERMRQAGIAAVNVDLIAGLPHQTAKSWAESLKVLGECGANHASVYMLEVDEDSRLGRELLAGGGRYHAAAVPSEDLVTELYETSCDFFAEQGLQQYEISNFARDGGESRHNLKYWQRKPYLGLGVDAHSMLRTTGDEVLRFSMTEDLRHFQEGGFDPDSFRVSREQQLEEAWFLGLRLNRGVSFEELRDQFGTVTVADFDEVLFAEILRDLRDQGLIDDASERIRLTKRGRLLSNEVFARFLNVQNVQSVRKEAAPEELICIS